MGFIREENQSEAVCNYKVFTVADNAEEWDPVIHHIDSSFAIRIIIILFERRVDWPQMARCSDIMSVSVIMGRC